jgi:hypothetical protein
MPQKIKMVISNGGIQNQIVQRDFNSASLASFPIKAPTSLNASMIARIHSVKPGCGSCGRH